MLEQAFPERKIIALNIAGNGSRHKEVSPTSISAMVDDLKLQISSFLSSSSIESPTDFTESVDIIAISMGGMIALEWMRKYPKDVHSAILINSSLSNYSPFYKRLKWQQYNNILKFFFISKDQRESLIFDMTTRQSPVGLIDSWIEWSKANPVSTSNTLRQLYAASRFRLESSPLTTTLLIGSQNDALVDISCSKTLAKHWHIPMMVHPEAGHDLPSDDPSWLLDKVTLFYQRQNSALKENESNMN
ncbi:alpha/beta hydrolase [Photobacterium rosenbergii]|nr:alpha/beta hydrolase [Photobacterium rosenbergii]